MQKRSMLALLLIAALTLTSLVALPDWAQTSLAQDDAPDMIMAMRTGYHPEGIDWDAERGVFITGSITEGGVFTVDDEGTVTRLGEAQEGLASIGVQVDAERGRVLAAMSNFAATGDQEVRGTAALAAYDLETGEQIFFTDLSDLLEEGRNFGNDVAVDGDGNAYVTNSFSPVIYRVDVDGNAEVFLQSDEFAVQGFGLNGIDYNAEGNYLLVAVAGKSALYKVPVDDPEALSMVELDIPLGIDGMVLHTDGYVYAVATMSDSGEREVVVLGSDDDWASASVMARQTTEQAWSATTLAMRGDVPYVVHAHFGQIGSGLEAFEIVAFPFEMDMMMEGGDMGGEAMQQGPDGATLVENRCSTCHSLDRVNNASKSADGWASTVDRMISYGANLNADERQAVIDYLASN